MDEQVMGRPAIGVIKDLKTIDPNTIPHVLEEGELGCALEWMVSDTKTGEVKEHVIKKSESFVQQFLQILFAKMICTPREYGVSIRDTGNTLRTVGVCGNAGLIIGTNGGTIFDVMGGAGVVTYGIVVGTGAVAPTISDYVLGTPIAHGVGAGQLQYGAVTFGAPASDATTSQLTITRNFANGSGGAVTVQEIGLYCRAFYWEAQGYFMIIRDTTGGIAVPNGQTLTVNYRPQAVA